jgi:heme exporter protein CcmB
VLVFAFGFVREGRAVTDAAAGILWIAIAFSGTLALGRAFERERQNETLRALMLAPVDRPALYVGKLLGVLILLALVEIVLVPLVALMFQAPLFQHMWLMLGLLGGGTLGFAAVGTLFAAMLVRARSRDVLLPLLLYPMTIPVLIAGVRGTAALLQADVDEPMARAWVAMLAFFDVVFVTLALWTFEPVMTE